MNEDFATIIKQNETIIMLLGKLAFKENEVREIVTKKKQNPEKYICGYNSCDGSRTVTQIAAIVGVKHPTLVPILRQWEELGIIYEAEKAGGKFYRKIFPI
ncbi:MAG: hypothetical protein ABSE39_08305 [Candidatus Bathyarchaeia archaeon]|jgi:hypothetical protein